MKNHRLPILLAVLAVLLLAAGAVWWWGRQPAESAGQLARAALAEGNTETQREAANRLAALAEAGPGGDNPVQPHLVRVLKESRNPGVRAACLRGLAAVWDESCVDLMLQGLDDPSPEVSEAAGRALDRLMSARPTFRPDEDPRQRAARLREAWKGFLQRRQQAIEAQKRGLVH